MGKQERKKGNAARPYIAFAELFPVYLDLGRVGYFAFETRCIFHKLVEHEYDSVLKGYYCMSYVKCVFGLQPYELAQGTREHCNQWG